MSVGTSNINHSKIGTCPHGLPQGACPVCNGMAGGNSTTKRDVPRNPGEMTYNQCAAIGAMIKAQKNAQKRAEIAQQNYLQSLADFAKIMANIQEKVMNFNAKISNSLPVILAKPLNFVISQTIGRLINIIANTPIVISNVINKFIEISDKLTAIYGEAKSAIRKTAEDFWAKIKKKFKSIFFITEREDIDNDEYKIDEAKKTYNLKTFIHNLAQKLKERKLNEH